MTVKDRLIELRLKCLDQINEVVIFEPNWPIALKVDLKNILEYMENSPVSSLEYDMFDIHQKNFFEELRLRMKDFNKLREEWLIPF